MFYSDKRRPRLAMFYKHKPRGFNYVPRYFDPEKEERERRKAELGLDSGMNKNDQLRTRMRNSMDNAQSKRGSGLFSSRTTGIILIVVLFVAFRYMTPMVNFLMRWFMDK